MQSGPMNYLSSFHAVYFWTRGGESLREEEGERGGFGTFPLRSFQLLDMIELVPSCTFNSGVAVDPSLQKRLFKIRG